VSDLTTKEYIVEYIKALKAVEDEMEPYKEHKRDLRNNYVKNGWLTKEEMRQAVRAYRMLKKGDDFNQFNEFFEQLAKKVGAS
jgi:Zn-dependent M32 family carboxypeptidase|tara:strand:+ start:211 stop:459 length:249 start_codon:yes stop_codon:yes gene_type:complete